MRIQWKNSPCNLAIASIGRATNALVNSKSSLISRRAGLKFRIRRAISRMLSLLAYRIGYIRMM
ncbi:unnamed protein product [Musa acuminata subsp. malaccensis]|uniref:(wild Malaysian banana) hypothetical protein n=1 Tax=Musa acuminata subsp. malaccensis TaxID=214687 RepID=A0A804HZG4_MUSAM|nr:unnamed protein product [Musa acuminata subsp. malaccensis]